MRNCDTRPISWRIVQNKALARAVIKEGYEIDRMWEGLLTWRDNLGYFDGSPAVLQEYFYALFKETSREISVEKAASMRKALEDEGLIIVYQSGGREYILIPKIGNHGGIIGGMSTKSNYPPCPVEIIKAWEERFNDIYMPPQRRINDVYTPYKQRINDIRTEGQGQGQDKGQERHGKQKTTPDLNLTDCKDGLLKILDGLDVKGKDKLLETYCKGLKDRTRCYDPAKCLLWLEPIIRKTKKNCPKDPYRYLEGSIKNFLSGK
jgi:hypothetical protein